MIKNELLFIPLYGWALASIRPIAINRAQGASAIKQVLSESRKRLEAGFWVVIFPEGTRVAPGDKHPYARSAATIAKDFNCPIVPVAHNAGVFWPRDTFIKRPGCIEMLIGDPVLPDQKSASELTTQCEEWIENNTDALVKNAAGAYPV